MPLRMMQRRKQYDMKESDVKGWMPGAEAMDSGSSFFC